MSWFHFLANEVYSKRVIQLGEDPSRVFNVEVWELFHQDIKFAFKKRFGKKYTYKIFIKKHISYLSPCNIRKNIL